MFFGRSTFVAITFSYLMKLDLEQMLSAIVNGLSVYRNLITDKEYI